MATEREVRLMLNVIPKGTDAIKRMFDEISKGGGSFGGGGQRALEDAAQSIFKMHKAAHDLKAQMDPAFVKAQADAEYKLTEARKKHREAIDEELKKLSPKPTFGQRFASGLTGGAAGRGSALSGGAIGEGAGALLGGAFGAVAGPIGIAAGALVSLGKAAVDFAGKASPAAAQRFGTAIEDMQAVIGRLAVPWLEILTDQIRLFGDVLITVLPSTAEVREAMSPIRQMWAAIRDVMGGLAPILKLVANELLKAFAFAVKALATPLLIVTEMLKEIGVIAESNKLNSSYGASGVRGSFVGIEELGRKTQLAALMAGMDGGTKSAQETMASTAKEIRDYVKEIWGFLGADSSYTEDEKREIFQNFGQGALEKIFGEDSAVIGFLTGKR